MKAILLFAATLLSSSVMAAAAPTAKPTVQYLKNCHIVKQRVMSGAEVSAYQDLQRAEQTMRHLQQPLDEMQAKLKPHEEQMQRLSVQVSAQAKRGDLDDDLVQAQTIVAKELSATVDIYQKDIDRVSAYSKELENKANTFSTLIQQGVEKDSFDQIRIQQLGEQSSSCTTGIFFSKSLQL